VRNDFDLALALLADLDDIAKVTGAALNLDAVVKELLESLDVEDLVVDGLRAVDDELLGDLLAALLGGASVPLLHGT
jgi:phosphosulfolactate phosphohydrolase-like enzyme